MFILDTNVVSELRKAKSGKANGCVIAWATTVFADELYLSAITLFELELGILQVERRDLKQGQMLRDWLEHCVRLEFRNRILPIDEKVALRCAGLHVPHSRSERDAWIAATAFVHNMTVVTRNTKDFEGTGADLLNPWIDL